MFRAGHGLHGNIFRAHNMNDCPDLAVFSGLLGGHPVEREDDGLGEELRVLLAHSMRNGHHQLPRPGGMTRLDPSGEEGLGRGVLVG